MYVHTVRIRPTTTLGRWAIWLALGFVVFNLAWAVLPGAGRLAIVSGIGGAAAAAVAIVRRGERGLAVYGAILPLLLVAAFVLAELLGD